LINSPLSNNEREILLLDQSSKFIVSFEQGDHPDALVAGTGQLNAVQIAVGDTNSWASEHTANTPQWSFTPTISQLIAGQGIELTISNLVTSSASGLACIYIDYQNIGSYPDGRLVIPIEKTPLLYSGENVGIGINNPQAKLHVNGGDAVISGKVGIGTTTPTAKLHVNGGNAVISGKVGIGTTNPNIHLAIGDNDTGLQQQGDGQLAIYTNNSERVRVNASGNVGIGTTDPKTKLHVNGGDALISGKVGIGMSTSPKIHLAIGDDDTGLQQQGDGQLAIYTNNAERVRVNASGNVGIGTTSPAAKLHVDGSVKFGGNSTIINQMICGQVFYNTVDKKWQYKGFAKGTRVVHTDDARFTIHYGFTVEHRQELAIFATPIYRHADNLITVQEVHEDRCVICMIDLANSKQPYEPTNFSFMIIHFGSPSDLYYFYKLENNRPLKHSAPIESYDYNRK
jgi:hypothetical protein